MLERLSAPNVIPRGILLGWAVWWSVIVASNLTDALTELGLLGDFGWTSGNYALLVEGAGGGGLGIALYFGLGIAWEAAACALFWRAVRAWDDRSPAGKAAARAAFAVSVAFWFAFLISNELVLLHKTPDPPMVHWIIFIGQVACYCAMGPLNDGVRARQ